MHCKARQEVGTDACCTDGIPRICHETVHFCKLEFPFVSFTDLFSHVTFTAWHIRPLVHRQHHQHHQQHQDDCHHNQATSKTASSNVNNDPLAGGICCEWPLQSRGACAAKTAFIRPLILHTHCARGHRGCGTSPGDSCCRLQVSLAHADLASEATRPPSAQDPGRESRPQSPSLAVGRLTSPLPGPLRPTTLSPAAQSCGPRPTSPNSVSDGLSGKPQRSAPAIGSVDHRRHSAHIPQVDPNAGPHGASPRAVAGSPVASPRPSGCALPLGDGSPRQFASPRGASPYACPSPLGEGLHSPIQSPRKLPPVAVLTRGPRGPEAPGPSPDGPKHPSAESPAHRTDPPGALRTPPPASLARRTPELVPLWSEASEVSDAHGRALSGGPDPLAPHSRPPNNLRQWGNSAFAKWERGGAGHHAIQL